MPRKEGRRSLAISYSSNKYPNRVPRDEILLRVFFGGALEPDVVDKSDAALIELARLELQEVLGWTGSETRWQAVIRWPQAMPQYTVGHTDRVAQLMHQLTQTPGLELCGAAYRGVGIPQCVRSGREAANRLLATLREER